MTSSLTNAEKQEIELQREAYVEGLLRWVPDDFTRANAQDLALRRYPDPKEPTVIQFEDGSQGKMVGIALVKRLLIDAIPPRFGPWCHTGYTLSDCVALGEIAQEAQQEMEK